MIQQNAQFFIKHLRLWPSVKQHPVISKLSTSCHRRMSQPPYLATRINLTANALGTPAAAAVMA
jgi:hypothetical protein